ncbi:MAG: hypothetical protein IKO64_05600 [Kiritimatiellae bacterium]|nr:hypothetical protein [Kiritimatiellia bacterium]
MIEQLLEAALVSAIESLQLAKLKVEGFWAVPATGEVKLAEGPAYQAYVRVKAAVREFETFSAPRCSVALKVGLAVRQEWGVEGLADYAGVIAAKLQEYQLSLPAVKRDFAVAGFAPHGARVDGGEPVYDEGSCMYSVGFQLTVRGYVSETNETAEL